MGKIDFQAARKRMVERQIAGRGITSPRILEAFLDTPRHLFVPKAQHLFAYEDGPLPIGKGQTISQPYIVAYMTKTLDLEGNQRVLEIGTGSGYQAAILGKLTKEVYTVERHPALAESAEQLFQDLGYENIQVHVGDGTRGLPDFAPYDAIMVTAAAPEVPGPLLDQLVDGGRLIMPVGGRTGQVLHLYQRQGKEFTRRDLTPVAFVPLIGAHGWPMG